MVGNLTVSWNEVGFDVVVLGNICMGVKKVHEAGKERGGVFLGVFAVCQHDHSPCIMNTRNQGIVGIPAFGQHDTFAGILVKGGTVLPVASEDSVKTVGVGVSGVAVVVGPCREEYHIAPEVFITHIGSVVVPYV
jgi:hypothetical protein